MTLSQLLKTLDYAHASGHKLDADIYSKLEAFILERTEDDQYRQLLMDRLTLLK